MTSKAICKKAYNNNLCDGLDILYGDGYKGTCCKEHVLCC
jgi:hypothetical protein